MAIDKATVGGKDTAGFSEEYERGYAAGRISAQPQWISVEERLEGSHRYRRGRMLERWSLGAG